MPCFGAQSEITYIFFGVYLFSLSKHTALVAAITLHLCVYQQHHSKSPNSHYLNTNNTERWISIGGQTIVMRYILTKMQIAWIQVNCGNPLLYPFSVRNPRSPERGILYILIVYFISKIALVFFSLLCASNYQYK